MITSITDRAIHQIHGGCPIHEYIIGCDEFVRLRVSDIQFCKCIVHAGQIIFRVVGESLRCFFTKAVEEIVSDRESSDRSAPKNLGMTLSTQVFNWMSGF